MNRKQKAYRNAGIWMAAFFVLMILVLHVDVRGIGADGMNVGLSHLNGAVHFITRSHPYIYAFTEVIRWIAVLVALSFTLLAVWVLIKKRTLRSVRGIACLIPTYAMMLPFWFFLNVFTVNCGPALLLGESHPSNSFPSMTTVFCLVVFGTALIEWHRLFRDQKALLEKLDMAGMVLIGITLLVRLLAGMNWFTDLLAAVFLSLSLINLYKGLCIRVVYTQEHHTKETENR